MADFTPLTPAQAIDHAWSRAIKPQLRLRLSDLRTALESTTCTPESTASLRGRIALLKELLALETDPAKARRQIPAEFDSAAD